MNVKVGLRSILWRSSSDYTNQLVMFRSSSHLLPFSRKLEVFRLASLRPTVHRSPVPFSIRYLRSAMDVPADAASADAAPTTLAPPASPVGEPSLSPAPSKSALKKAAKAERLAAQKLERRAREKEAKKEKRRTRAAKRAAGELDSAEEAAEEAERRAKRARTSRPTKFFNARVVVDLAFDEKMTDKVRDELYSLAVAPNQGLTMLWG